MSLAAQRLKVAGGEPVALVATLQATIAMMISFGWLDFIGLHTQADSAIVAVVLNAIAGVYLMFATAHPVLAPLVELFKALTALGALYGLHLTEEQNGLAILVISGIFGLLTHRQITSPSPPAPQVEPQP